MFVAFILALHQLLIKNLLYTFVRHSAFFVLFTPVHVTQHQITNT